MRTLLPAIFALLILSLAAPDAAGSPLRAPWIQGNAGSLGDFRSSIDTADAPVRSTADGPLAPAVWLTELLPGTDYAAWYQAQLGVTPNPRYFGAYALRAVDSTLYIGFGTARPAEDGDPGGLLAGTDGVTLSPLLTLTEEGFIDIEPAGSVLAIPGPDPTDPGWAWGNFYQYTTPDGPGIKYRNLPNVIHSWGAWWDGSQLYAAVSSHLGDDSTWSGQVFRTDDPANGWTLLADRDDGVGQYRTYDIIGFSDKLYLTWNDAYPTPCGLASSSDGGLTWTRPAAPDTQCRSRLIVFAGKLLALNLPQAGFVAVDTAGNISTIAFSNFVVTDWAYNYAAVDGAVRLYVVTLDGRIMRTADLSGWQTLASTDLELITLGYWPDRNWLIAANRGSAAGVWKLDLTTATPLTLIQAPAWLSAAIDNDAVVLDWPDVTLDEANNPATPGAYRTYRHTDPYFTPSAANRISITADSELIDNNIGGTNVIGDVTTNYFYVVRTEDAAGSLSTWSPRVGEFDFALTAGS